MSALDADARAPRWVALRALRAAAKRPPVWLTTWALVFLLAVVGTLPWFRFFDEALARYAPGSQVASLTEVFRADNASAMDALARASGETGAGLALLAMLVGVFCAGGWLQVFLERTAGHSLRRFFFGGSRFFFRFLRLLLITLVVLGVASWLIYGRPWEIVVEGFLLQIEDPEELVSELSARRLAWFQHGLFALVVGLAMVWGDYTRARLAIHEAQSAVWAGLCSVFTLLRHPVRTLLPALTLFGFEWVVLWFLGGWVVSLGNDFTPESDTRAIWAMFVVVQGTAMIRAVVRGAHLHAAVRVTRHVIEPPSRPDPWRNRVGGPGGPQYPIGGDDYGVSI